MKNPLCIVLFMIIGAAFVNMYARGSGDDAGRSREVVVYAYDSFVSEWGPGPELKRLFEEKTGYTVTLVSCGDAAEVLSRAVREKASLARMFSSVLILPFSHKPGLPVFLYPTGRKGQMSIFRTILFYRTTGC